MEGMAFLHVMAAPQNASILKPAAIGTARTIAPMQTTDPLAAIRSIEERIMNRPIGQNLDFLQGEDAQREIGPAAAFVLRKK